MKRMHSSIYRCIVKGGELWNKLAAHMNIQMHYKRDLVTEHNNSNYVHVW